MRRRLQHVLICGLWLAMLAVRAPAMPAAEARIAVAANFAGPMQRLVPLFESATGHRLLVAVGSTGALHAQIRHGAPFDVFLAGDTTTPAMLRAAGVGVEGYSFTYATGRLVLWSGDPRLVDGEWRRLAIANPALAPYGKAAIETLGHLGLIEQVRSRLVQGENIAQTLQFVASGNAQLGFVALSQVMQDGRMTAGSMWRVPREWHAAIAQDALLLQRGRDNPAAVAFLEFLRGARAREVMQRFGYEFPAEGS
jgi:molybdate transport system substrate-binding protein